MYTGLLHTHKLVVVLFLLIYVCKLVLLLSGKSEALQRFSKAVRIPEIIVSTLFLLTGVGMLLQIAAIDNYLIIKLVSVFASIPLAIIGFKKGNKPLAVLSVLLLFAAYGLAEMSKRNIERKEIAQNIIETPTESEYDLITHGKAVYQTYCTSCHGEDGAKGLSGAKNLQISVLSEAEATSLIVNGKGNMASYKNILKEQEIKAVVAYIQMLKKP